MAASKHWDVVVIGGANTDYFLKGRRLPKPGETVDGKTFLTAPGGKGANQAVAAARLGARVAFVGRCGADARGDEMLQGLQREGIDTRRVVRDKMAPTGVALVMVDESGEKQIMVAPGANQRLSVADLQRAAELIRRARVVLMQFEVPMKSVLHAARLARKAGAKIVLDPAPPYPAPTGLLPLVDIIRPNSSEAKALTGIQVTDRASARRAARKFLALGVSAVVLQAGEEGNLIVRETSELPLPQIRVKTVDETGAGDAFIAALAVAAAQELPFELAGAFATAAAALATTRLGAQPAMPVRQEVLRLMAKSGYKAEARAMARTRASSKGGLHRRRRSARDGGAAL
jgi:ribokinase